MSTSTDLIKQLEYVEYEPTRMQSIAVDLVERAATGDLKLTDPGTPLVSLVELAVTLAASAIKNDEILDRKSYPYMAITESDLYGHMSDVDFVDMFASPGEATFNLYFSKAEVINKAVRIGSSNSRKLTLPKHTKVTANGVPFTFQYPVNFLVRQNDTLDIVYDTTHESPLQSMSGNKVEWRTIRINSLDANTDSTELIELKVKLKQMRQTTYYETISTATVLKKRVKLQGNYYSTRAYIRTVGGEWTEIKTTHSQQSFDISSPTLLLNVTEDTLLFEMPYVYMLGNLTGRELRVDVYTTAADLTMDLSGLLGTQFAVEFVDRDNDHDGIYTAPLSTLNTFDIRSTDMLSGGKKEPTFVERRDKVLRNKLGPRVLPITQEQLSNALELIGFDTIMNLDNLSKRTFIATRSYPVNPKSVSSTGIDATLMTLRSSIDEISNLSTVADNDERVTILPTTLYESKNGVLSIVPQSTLDTLGSMTQDALVNRINGRTYLWTPFHYVLDSKNNSFNVRPYLLDLPSMDVTSYIASSETSGLIVMSSSSRVITRIDNGYRITIMSDSNQEFKALRDDQIHVQLGFYPDRESKMAYVNGTIVGRTDKDEIVVSFDIITNWDILDNNHIAITNFQMFNGTSNGLYTALHTDFQLFWTVSDYSPIGLEPSSIDTELGNHLLPNDVVGIYQEELCVRFGDELTGLWSGARSLLGDRKPVKYTEDVYLTYQSGDRGRYDLDPDTGYPKVIMEDGRRVLSVLHEVGDPVTDVDTGLPIILHRKGDPVMTDGTVTYESGRYTMWWFDLVLFDAKYRFANSKVDVDYRNFISKLTVEWTNDLLGDIRDQKLEVTDIYFHPHSTMKHSHVLVDDALEVEMDSVQRLTVDIFVTRSIYNNFDLRKSIELTVKELVYEGISKTEVSTGHIAESVINALPELKGIKVHGLGGSKNYSTVTLLDDSTRLSIAKELVVDDDGKMLVKDNLQISFKLHDIVS